MISSSSSNATGAAGRGQEPDPVQVLIQTGAGYTIHFNFIWDYLMAQPWATKAVIAAFWVIYRFTLGYHRQTWEIPYSFFKDQARLSENAAIGAVNRLEAHGLISVDRRREERKPNIYTIEVHNFVRAYEAWRAGGRNAAEGGRVVGGTQVVDNEAHEHVLSDLHYDPWNWPDPEGDDPSFQETLRSVPEPEWNGPDPEFDDPAYQESLRSVPDHGWDGPNPESVGFQVEGDDARDGSSYRADSEERVTSSRLEDEVPQDERTINNMKDSNQIESDSSSSTTSSRSELGSRLKGKSSHTAIREDHHEVGESGSCRRRPVNDADVDAILTYWDSAVFVNPSAKQDLSRSTARKWIEDAEERGIDLRSIIDEAAAKASRGGISYVRRCLDNPSTRRGGATSARSGSIGGRPVCKSCGTRPVMGTNFYGPPGPHGKYDAHLVQDDYGQTHCLPCAYRAYYAARVSHVAKPYVCVDCGQTLTDFEVRREIKGQNGLVYPTFVYSPESQVWFSYSRYRAVLCCRCTEKRMKTSIFS